MNVKADPPIRVLGRETLSKRFVNLEKVTIEHATRSGGRIVVEREIHDHGNAAAILLHDPVRKVVVLVRQVRAPVFLNGGEGGAEEGEDRYMAPSPKVATYDLQPEMSAAEVGDKLVEAIEKQYDLIVINFANPDMVGHTGVLEAAIKAVETVDTQLGRAIAALEKVGGAVIVTADHGNCETMVDPVTGGPHTAHTTNLVPVVMYGGPEGVSLRDGKLSDLAPSLLELMGLEQPEEMTGESLIVH